MTIISRKPRPEAGCMRCGRPYTAALDETAMCARIDANKKPCGGRISWRPNRDDWTECLTCGGTGVRDEKSCAHCHGDGWLMGKL